MAYIDRELMFAKLREKATTKFDWSEQIDVDDFEKVVKEIPTADVVEVVRCKDCKSFFAYTDDDKADGYNIEGADGVCSMRIENCSDSQICATKNSDYCSYGERRDT